MNKVGFSARIPIKNSKKVEIIVKKSHVESKNEKSKNEKMPEAKTKIKDRKTSFCKNLQEKIRQRLNSTIEINRNRQPQ